MIKNQNGNVLIYILIAVALMAALAYAISGDTRGNQADRMDEEKAKLLAAELLSHAREAERVVFQMMQWGADIDDLKFDLPGSADYSTNTTNQVYHPAGGGLQPMQNLTQHMESAYQASSWVDWRHQGATNVDWTQSSGTDLIYSKGGLTEQVCREINNIVINDDSTQLVVNTFSFGDYFYQGQTTDTDLTPSACPICENQKALCITRNTGTPFRLFYYIIAQR